MISEEKEYAANNYEEFVIYCNHCIEAFHRFNFQKTYKLNLNENAYGFLSEAFFKKKNTTDAGNVLYTTFSVEKNQLTDAEKRFNELEFKRNTEIKQFYDAYNNVLQSIERENGMLHHWEENGVVYQLDEPKGTFVEYKKLCVNRTRYDWEIAEGKRDSSLSMKKAEELGYQVEGAKKKK